MNAAPAFSCCSRSRSPAVGGIEALAASDRRAGFRAVHAVTSPREASRFKRQLNAGPSRVRFFRARLGPVKALAPLDPLRGLAALTGRSVEPNGGIYVMARRALAWGTMEEIISADAPDPISLDRCRELLGDEAAGLSDEPVDRIRQHAETMAHVLIEICLQDRSTTQYR
jgi:hypothetical protein